MAPAGPVGVFAAPRPGLRDCRGGSGTAGKYLCELQDSFLSRRPFRCLRPPGAGLSCRQRMEGWRMAEVKQRRSGKAAGAAERTGSPQTTGKTPADAKPAKAAAASAAADDPVRALRERETRAMEANGAGVLNILFALAEASEEDRRVPRAVQAAKLFLIAVIFIAPVLLMWQHAF